MSNLSIKVPFLDLQTHHAPIRGEIDSAIRSVIDECAFAGGRYVEAFEAEFAAFCGSRFAVGVSSGTDALWLALLASGVGLGDEVITVPMTFMATAEAITHAGARPVFVDIDPVSYTMNADGLEAAITPRTKAIVPVHLFGRMADMDAISRIAGKQGIPVIEDAAQAHGATQCGQLAGSFGVAGCFSFYPGKNLGAFGEAGAIVTNDESLNETVRMLRDHGQERKYSHKLVGWNARMDGIQGAVLSIKLRQLHEGNQRRHHHALRYIERLNDLPGIVLPLLSLDFGHVFHVFAIRVQERDALMQALQARGIMCGIHYPIPVHLQEAYANLEYGEGSFPVAEQCAREFLSLPMYPELTNDQIDFVTDAIREWSDKAIVA